MGVATAFQAISSIDGEYPLWFSEGKTSLIPKPGEFTSDNQRPITCLNTMYKWYTSCLLVPTDKHLDDYDLMEGAQRAARAGCSGTIDNLLIDQMVTLDCHRKKRNLSMGWVDVKKAYDSIDHGWLEEMMIIHRFPTWLCRTTKYLSRSWSTRIVVTTRNGREASEIIKFRKGRPQGDALCPRLFTVCLNPIAWKISASEGYRLSKPIGTTITDLLYIDDLKIFAASESKLSSVMNSVRAAMEDVGLIWNPKKCAVAHFKRGVRVPESTGLLMSDGNVKIPTLEDGQQYKFLGVLETLRQEEKIVLRCAAREYLRRLSVIWSSPLSDYHRVIASNQFALPAMSYFMWTQHWPITELRQVDRDARKIVTEGGGKHPCGTTSLLYLRESRMEGVVEEQKWQGKLITARKEDGDLNTEQCFWWLNEWRMCPTHTIAGMFEIYEQLLPTRLYAIHKTQASPNSDPTCRLCGTAPESMAHILSACPALAQTKYLARHDAVLKVLFFDIMEDLGLIEASPPWYSPTKPQPVYEGVYAQAYWDVPVFGEYQDLRANRIDARIVNHQEKKVITMEMSCPWVSNRQKKTSEKTMKYAPLRWELKQKYPGYEISQYNIIVDVLGGWSTDVEVAVKELVGRRHKDVLKKMQKACLSATLNIARTFKVATH